jgi:hypothetical protein
MLCNKSGWVEIGMEHRAGGVISNCELRNEEKVESSEFRIQHSEDKVRREFILAPDFWLLNSMIG